MSIDPRNDPRARIVIKPLPSQQARKSLASDGGRKDLDRTAVEADPFIRAENEDDDGYDPYSDRPAEREPLFQEDPWG